MPDIFLVTSLPLVSGLPLVIHVPPLLVPGGTRDLLSIVSPPKTGAHAQWHRRWVLWRWWRWCCPNSHNNNKQSDSAARPGYTEGQHVPGQTETLSHHSGQEILTSQVTEEDQGCHQPQQVLVGAGGELQEPDQLQGPRLEGGDRHGGVGEWHQWEHWEATEDLITRGILIIKHNTHLHQGCVPKWFL